MIINLDNDTIQVPKVFFNHLTKLSELEVKAYLLLFTADRSITSDEMACKLSVSKDKYLDLIRSLSRKGLICSETGKGDELCIRINHELSNSSLTKCTLSLFEKVSQIKGRPLSNMDVEAIIFMSDLLSLNEPLILKIAEISCDNHSFSPAYMKSIAIRWKEKGIETLQDYERYAEKAHNSIASKALRALGRYERPTEAELAMVNHWTNDYGFTEDMIIYACDKTSVATSKNRLKYADCVLQSWYDHGLKTKEDVDSFAPIKITGSAAAKKSYKPDNERSYDFDELEKQLLDN